MLPVPKSELTCAQWFRSWDRTMATIPKKPLIWAWASEASKASLPLRSSCESERFVAKEPARPSRSGRRRPRGRLARRSGEYSRASPPRELATTGCMPPATAARKGDASLGRPAAARDTDVAGRHGAAAPRGSPGTDVRRRQDSPDVPREHTRPRSTACRSRSASRRKKTILQPGRAHATNRSDSPRCSIRRNGARRERARAT